MPTKPYPPTPSFNQLLMAIPPQRLGELMGEGVTPTPEGRYLHWEELRHRPAPEGVTHEEWWLTVLFARSTIKRNIALTDPAGKPFSYCLPPPLLEKLHRLDKSCAGHVALPDPILNENTRDRFLVNSLVEEAITSSQLEGASTTRQAASQMLRSGRSPQDKDERMILNNFRAMQHVRSMGELSPAAVLELHEIVTADTLIRAEDAGRLQAAGDRRVVVQDHRSQSVLHTPPPADQLEARMSAMCEFANATEKDEFTHPLVKAIILHFWLAYDHPFVDGNGRAARALFYWSALRSGYWLLELTSISRILKRAPARYSRSFLFTESDHNDLTYFIDAQLTVLAKAVSELEHYIKKKVDQTRQAEELLREKIPLNHRQLALLGHALRHPGKAYTIASHQNSHRVVYATARSDLLDLAQAGLLSKQKRNGKTLEFVAPSDLVQRIEAMPGPA